MAKIKTPELEFFTWQCLCGHENECLENLDDAPILFCPCCQRLLIRDSRGGTFDAVTKLKKIEEGKWEVVGNLERVNVTCSR